MVKKALAAYAVPVEPDEAPAVVPVVRRLQRTFDASVSLVRLFAAIAASGFATAAFAAATA